MIAFFTLAGFTFLVTQYFQFVRGYTAFGTGLRILPVAISIAVAAIVGTRLAVRIGNKAVVATGLFAFGLALFWIAAAASVSTSYAVLAATMILSGTGLGLITAPATESILGAVPKEKAGVGSAVNDATRLFGATLGVAVIGSISASLYAARLAATIPAGLPAQAVADANGSVGGALDRGTGAAARRPAGASPGVGRGRDQRVPPQLLVEPSRRRPCRVRWGRAGRHPAPFPSRTRSIRRRRADRRRLGRSGGG